MPAAGTLSGARPLLTQGNPSTTSSVGSKRFASAEAKLDALMGSQGSVPAVRQSTQAQVCVRSDEQAVGCSCSDEQAVGFARRDEQAVGCARSGEQALGCARYNELSTAKRHNQSQSMARWPDGLIGGLGRTA